MLALLILTVSVLFASTTIISSADTSGNNAVIAPEVPAETGSKWCTDSQKVINEINNNGKLDGLTIAKTIDVTSEDIEDRGFQNAVQNALNEAGHNTEFFKDLTEEQQQELTLVIVRGGDNAYALTKPLMVYSNTIVYFDGKTDIYPAGDVDDTGNLFRCGISGAKNTSSGYDSYKNITLIGGTFHGKTENGKGVHGCNIRFGHASNIRVIGTTVKDNCGSHHMEIGAVDGLTIANCAMSGFCNPDDANSTDADGEGYVSIEAIQLDVTHRENRNFAAYGKHDALPVRNAAIEYCDFNNVQRGVGSHHMAISKGNQRTYDKIRIHHNTFKNIPDKAVTAEYFTNSEIDHNTMVNVNSGINVCNMVYPQAYQPLQEAMDADGGLKKATAADQTLDMNTTVHDNTIQLDDTLVPWKNHTEIKYGIRVGGDEVTNDDKKDEAGKTTLTANEHKNTPIPNGWYYTKNVKVINNTISVYESSSATKYYKKNINFGIFLYGVKSSVIKGNKVDLKGHNYYVEGKDPGYGIRTRQITATTIENNTVKNISNTNGQGISIGEGATGGTIKGNTVAGVKDYGIIVLPGSTVTNIQNNKVSNTGIISLYIKNNAKVTGLISGNTLTGSSQSYNILTVNGVVKTISGNTFKGKGYAGLYCTSENAKNLANITTITGNTMTDATLKLKDNGIFINGKTYKVTAAKLTNNKITSPGANGIRVEGTKAVTGKISGNTLTNCKTDSISFVKTGTASKACLISNNTITGNQSGHSAIWLKTSTVKNINGNTIKGTNKNGIYLTEGSVVTSAYNNTVTKPSKYGIFICGPKKVTKISNIYSNTIRTATNHGISVDGAKATAVTIYKNVVTGCRLNGICSNGKVRSILKNNTLKSNKKNVPVLTKGVSFKVNDVTVAKNKKKTVATWKSSTSGKVTWKTSNKKIVTVTNKGVIKGIKAGTANVTVAKDGLSETIKVTVK